MKNITKIIFLQFVYTALFVGMSFAAGCGDKFALPKTTSPDGMCSCDATDNEVTIMNGNQEHVLYCCGYARGTGCYTDIVTYSCGETSDGEAIPNGSVCSCSYTTTGDGGSNETVNGQWESYTTKWLLWESKHACCGWVSDDGLNCLSKPVDESYAKCGSTFTKGEKECQCAAQAPLSNDANETTYCCGWLQEDGSCNSTDVGISDMDVNSETLNGLNPLSVGNSNSSDLSTPGGIISRALKGFIFPIAGLILFATLLLGGFQMLTSATNSSGVEAGKQRITSAIIGFIILFAAYWIAQLLELIFGIRILS